jgi:hypothetical protein
LPPARKARHKAPAPRGRRAGWPTHERLWLVAALGVILVASSLRAVHLGFPLERDEGEFGYIAQEILRGVPMYDSAYTQKLPGTYLLYALFLSVFGQSIAAIHRTASPTPSSCGSSSSAEDAQRAGGLIGALVFGVMA